MASTDKQTLDADDEVCGPVTVVTGKLGFFSVAVTGTITVTLQRKIDGANWVAVEDGYTASTTKDIVGAGTYQLIASGTSSGSAVCFIGPQ